MNDVPFVFFNEKHDIKLYVFYNLIFGKEEKSVYRKRNDWKDIHTNVNRDYVPDRGIGPLSGSLVVTWFLLQGSHSPVVKTDVSTINYTNMF